MPESRRRPNLLDPEAFQQTLQKCRDPLDAFRPAVQHASARCHALFKENTPILRLLQARAQCVDYMLEQAWQQVCEHHIPDFAFVAVGGYGRAELHPGSDIDIAIVCKNTRNKKQHQEALARFIAFVWDMGLPISHSVRSLDEVVEDARDCTHYTNWLESRLVFGPAAIYHHCQDALKAAAPWTSKQFLQQKICEQKTRHGKHDHTTHKLEPNIKSSPGGLRDIQTLQWVARAHFQITSLHKLILRGILQKNEYNTLKQCQNFLWRLRYALHVLAGRGDDRLLLDYQVTIAKQWGYHDTQAERGVEQLMKQYYRIACTSNELNERLLQLLQDIICPQTATQTKTLNRNFSVQNHTLISNTKPIFQSHPGAIFDMFYLIAQHPSIHTISVPLTRELHQARALINEAYRNNTEHQACFLRILGSWPGVNKALHLMNRHGILGAYIQTFAQIVGKMQFDLFHIYTVDVHTLFVIDNLVSFSLTEAKKHYPLCADIMARIKNLQCIVLAALFHDIGKGRGGDHSILGAQDAEIFCTAHHMSEHDTRLITWLVKHHLLMSSTAQRKDINDPDIINALADQVRNLETLDHLYVLTIADIRATNPQLWNNWKHTLLRDLYHKTAKALKKRLLRRQHQKERITTTRTQALAALMAQGQDKAAILRYWAILDDKYFLRHRAQDITWQMPILLCHGASKDPLIDFREHPSSCATDIFIHLPNHDHIFATITHTLMRLRLQVVAARIFTSRNGFCFDTFTVIQANGQPINQPGQRHSIKQHLHKRLSKISSAIKPSTSKVPRRLRPFLCKSEIRFYPDTHNKRTILELFAPDRSDLLASIGRAFSQCQVHLLDAKINTLGERAEDVFFITNAQYSMLDETQMQRLEKAIRFNLQE